MPYFEMRRGRGSNISYILALVLGVFFLYFLYTVPYSSAIDKQDASQRTSTAGTVNHLLSPPTSPFQKSGDAHNRPPLVVHYDMNNLTTAPFPHITGDKVLILTPMARFYQEYWDNLVNLTYPHEHISLGYILPKTKEGNAATAALQAAIKKTQSGPQKKRFQSVTILRQDFPPPLQSQDEAERHKMSNQKIRRASMAKARNSLLFTTIGPQISWVLWLDGDIVETPRDLIQDLASYDKHIITPNCFQRYTQDNGEPGVRPYDYNNWVDSQAAQDLAADMDQDDILLEGYAEMATYRTLMAMMANTAPDRVERTLLKLDGVGGTALMVKAEVHRDGAMFPAFPFYHLIETEGFAKMASRLGFESWGLPNYFVYHYNE